MRNVFTYAISIFSIILLAYCGHPSTQKRIKIKNNSELIPIDYSDTNYVDVQIYVKDTITKDGWEIKYLVKNDSTKYNDVYIKCSKGKKIGIFHGEDLLQFRRYFIPKFVGETNTHIFFWHGCATDCAAILVFTKTDTITFKDYQNVVDYNIDFEQILYVTNKCYEHQDKIYNLSLVDLSNDREHEITFNNICTAVCKPACIDTVIFSKKLVTIVTTLREDINSEKNIKQTVKIKL